MDRAHAMELVQSFERGFLTRREFLTRVTVALGSAAAANTVLGACRVGPGSEPGPAVAPELETPPPGVTPGLDPEEGLHIEAVAYTDAQGGALTAYLARPDDEVALPAVVVIQEWWGLNDHIKDVTRRLGRAGFVALAPDLYHGVVVDEPNEARKLVMELDTDAAVAEIRRAVAYLGSRPDVVSPAVGIVGFCMGGGLVLQTALAEDNLGAAVAFYGRPLTADEAPRARAPILGLYGAKDGGISTSQVRQMESALAAAGIEGEFHVYDGAGHAFFNNTRSSYDADAARDAWQRTLAWLHEHLAG